MPNIKLPPFFSLYSPKTSSVYSKKPITCHSVPGRFRSSFSRLLFYSYSQCHVTFDFQLLYHSSFISREIHPLPSRYLSLRRSLLGTRGRGFINFLFTWLKTSLEKLITWEGETYFLKMSFLEFFSLALWHIWIRTPSVPFALFRRRLTDGQEIM